MGLRGPQPRLADVALESAEDVVAVLSRALNRARERRVAESITLPEADEILADLERAMSEAIEACEDIERASVGELIAASWLTGGPSPHLTRRALALGLNVGGLRLVVRNGEARDAA